MIAGINVEGKSRSEMIEEIQKFPRPTVVIMRDREFFFEKLNSTLNAGNVDKGNLKFDFFLS